MPKIIVPSGYQSEMKIKETEIAIKLIKDFFEQELAKALNMTRISAPLFVRPESGLNDNLNGIERPVSFDILDEKGSHIEIVQSLAKWKRLALKRYGFTQGEGIYTDMNAIRRDEVSDNTHSIYVDQWDWELVMSPEERNLDFLKKIVGKIYKVIKDTEQMVCAKYPFIEPVLPEEITFISSQELEREYPHLSPQEREKEIARKHRAVFIIGIGGALESGKPHDGRAPDYDDWNLNGDIIVYYSLLDMALELSSMGIRVDPETLSRQLEVRGCVERSKLPFQSALLRGELHQTIGGGIGQSRLCMFFLKKAHIGEVQASIWPEEISTIAANCGIDLL